MLSRPDRCWGAGLKGSVEVDEAAALTQVQALLAALSKALVFQSSHGLLQAVPDRLTEIEKGERGMGE